MTRLLLFVLLICIGSISNAASVSLRVPANVGRSTSGGFTASNSSVFSNGSYAANFITEVEGTSVTFPQTMRTAANAASFITPFLIPGPAGLITSAVLSWLGNYGLQQSSTGSWQVATGTVQNLSTYVYDNNPPANAADQYANVGSTGEWHWFAYPSAPHCGAVYPAGYVWVGGYYTASNYGNPAGAQGCYYFVWLRVQNQLPVARAAAQSDWDKVNNSTTPIPDAALNDLAKGGLAIPLTPSVDMTPKSVPLGVPVKSATDGNYYQDRATITPTSNTDPTQADLQVVKQQTDAAGNPAVNPADNSVVAPNKADDPCAEHPDRIGCLQKDQVATPDITQQTKTIAITPDTGWGADDAACPADIPMSLKNSPDGGASFSWGPVCQFGDKIRYVVIGFAWISAVLIALGISRRA